MEQLDAKLEIKDIYAREIFDAWGNMAVETEVLAGEGIVGRASVSSLPSAGKETGKTVENINSCIAQELVGKNVFEQEEIDRILTGLDGSEELNALGTDALFSVSAAVASTAAAALKVPLYRYLGGVHTKCMPAPAANVTDETEGMGAYMIVPSEQMTFRGQMDVCTNVYRAVRKILHGRKNPGAPGVRETFGMIEAAVERAGYRMGSDVMIAWDAAGAYRYAPDRHGYYIREETGELREIKSSGEMCEYYASLIEEYSICSLEDPLASEDWEGWVQISRQLGGRIQLIGNRLFGTDRRRLERGIELGTANAILIRPDQAGTLTRAADLIKTAQEAGYRVAIKPHEAGTADTLSADLAVAFRVGQMEAGAPCHMENMEKYNRLLRIEERLGESG